MKTWLKWIAGKDGTITETPASSSLKVGTADASTLEGRDSQNLRAWIGLFICLGLVARVIRYYLCFPLWDDESFLCVNFISRNYSELLRPLDYHQVAPILFLWIERTAVKLMGFSEYSLRVVPFICSVASLYLFHRIARQLVYGAGLLFAVAIFAVSYPGIRYAAEAKPYCTDMFISLVMLSLVVEWYQQRNVRMLGLLTALMPIALGLSYPAVFAAGGWSLVVAGILLTQRGTNRERIVWSAWNVSLVVSFAVWFLAVGRVQNGAEAEFMGEYWKQNFPPISQPWQLPFWMLKTHASDFLAYPMGGPNWASTTTLLLCCAGLWKLIKCRKTVWLGLLLGPACLHLLAAALQRYPYGGHVKFSQYLAPMICCLAGIGIQQFMDWHTRSGNNFKHRLACLCAIFIVIGLGSVFRDLANPYKTRSDFRSRAFAQSFWVGVHSAEEVACIKNDLGLDFVPEQHKELSWSAHYLCNQAIEVSRSSLKSAEISKISASRPLRCVMYRDARYELDKDRLEQWLSEMKNYYDLVAHESIPFPRFAKNDRRLVTMEYIDSFKFVPRPDSANQLPPLAQLRGTTTR